MLCRGYDRVLDLANGDLVELYDAQGTTLRVTRGLVWITQQDDTRAVVASGLQPGEQVVTTGFARLTEGTQVAASSAEDAGQLTPAGGPRPDGTRGTRGGDRAKGSPRAGLPRNANP